MAVGLKEIREAAEAQRGVVDETPLLNDEALSGRLGANVYLKAECLQRSGSFKLRGRTTSFATSRRRSESGA